MVGYTHQNVGESGGMLLQEILHSHIFLERFWCILSILVDKYLLRILVTYFHH